jgi:prepilin-type processing-associated H-X9-DG protein
MELLAVLALLALCAATLFPVLARTKAPSQRIYCANNLKGIAEAFQIWGQDHADAFPMRVAVRHGGYSDYVGIRTLTASQATSRGVFGMFACLSKELNTPTALICPAESEPRLPATTFDSLIPQNTSGVVPLTNDLNVSYFVGVDAAATNPRGFLAGDHNLGSDGNVLLPLSGFVTLPSTYRPDFKISLGTNFVTNGGVGWVNTMHSAQGNVALADGSVGMYNRAQLQNALRNSADIGGGGGPAFITAPGSFGAGVNRIQFP